MTTAISVILTVNTGSSSVRLAAFRVGEAELLPLAAEHFNAEAGEPEDLLRAFLCTHSLSPIAAVAHRVVHGGA